MILEAPVIRKWLVLWSGFSGNTQGAIWMLLGAVLFAGMGIGVKFLGRGLDSFQIAFLRAFFGFLVVLPFVLKRGLGSVRTHIFPMHLVRAIFGITAMFTTFYSLTHLPLADAVALTFTRPLFLIVLAVLFLGEAVRWRRWMATLAGFIGVVIMMQSGAQLEFASFVGLFGALMVAVVSVFLKKLTRTEAPTTILFYFTLIGSCIAIIPAWFVWVTPTVTELVILAAAASVGTAGNFCVIRALSAGDVTFVTPFDYTRLIFSGVLAYFLFGELPTIWMICGASVIVLSSLYILNREHQLKKAAAKIGN